MEIAFTAAGGIFLLMYKKVGVAEISQRAHCECAGDCSHALGQAHTGGPLNVCTEGHGDRQSPGSDRNWEGIRVEGLADDRRPVVVQPAVRSSLSPGLPFNICQPITASTRPPDT